MYLLGVIGVEAVSGAYAEQLGMRDLTYSIITTLEESLEMIGLGVFVWALLKYCAETYGDVVVEFKS